ncbi:MAG: alpha/beta hydrolase domain-containing protein [Pseudomonadota bacterium]
MRPPWIMVPAAAYMTDAETGCGLIYDTKIPYSARQLRELYGNYENCRRKFEAAKVTAIAQGYLLPEDAARVSPVAAPADFQEKTSRAPAHK